MNSTHLEILSAQKRLGDENAVLNITDKNLNLTLPNKQQYRGSFSTSKVSGTVFDIIENHDRPGNYVLFCQIHKEIGTLVLHVKGTDSLPSSEKVSENSILRIINLHNEYEVTNPRPEARDERELAPGEFRYSDVRKMALDEEVRRRSSGQDYYNYPPKEKPLCERLGGEIPKPEEVRRMSQSGAGMSFRPPEPSEIAQGKKDFIRAIRGEGRKFDLSKISTVNVGTPGPAK
ncbi:MAG: hypothetical protein WDZ88_03260 [Candidatus Paceibacterota bacterium]